MYNENITYNFILVSTILKEQSEYYYKIVYENRYYPTYFLCSTIGTRHKEMYTNKDFIYRGNILERVADFGNRIKYKFTYNTSIDSTTNSTNIDDNNDVIILKQEPTDADYKSNRTLLRILAVTPVCIEELMKLSIPTIYTSAAIQISITLL